MEIREWMKKVTEEEYDVIKRIIIDNDGRAHETITDGKRIAHIIMEDAYEED